MIEFAGLFICFMLWLSKFEINSLSTGFNNKIDFVLLFMDIMLRLSEIKIYYGLKYIFYSSVQLVISSLLLVWLLFLVLLIVQYLVHYNWYEWCFFVVFLITVVCYLLSLLYSYLLSVADDLRWNEYSDDDDDIGARFEKELRVVDSDDDDEKCVRAGNVVHWQQLKLIRL